MINSHHEIFVVPWSCVNVLMCRRQAAVKTPPQTLPHFLLVKTMPHVLLDCRKAGEGRSRLYLHCEGFRVLRVRVHEVKHALSV